MIKLLITLFLVVAYNSAYAQQQSPAPEVRAYAAKLLTEINNNLTCTTSTFELADKIAKLEAELKKLKGEQAPTE